jgi:putative oxidoreductase
MSSTGSIMRRYLPLNIDLGLLVLRVALAGILLTHGLPKLMNFGGTVAGFQGMHVPVPPFSAAFAALAENVGALLLLLGIAVDIAGLLVVIDMLGAILIVHLPHGFGGPMGWEHPFTILVIALALALAGPGRFSVGERGSGRMTERR